MLYFALRTHSSVTGIIDAAITALQFDAESTLWIGNAVCVNLQHENLTMERVGGLQGLITDNITSLRYQPTN
jgi:hypothetical protein